MNKFGLFCVLFLSACTHLTPMERSTLVELKVNGIDVDHPDVNWEKPASPAAAGALNLLPGFGNFYLASGNAGQSEHYLYGFLNLLTWPVSPLWSIVEATVDANTINKRELVYFYTYDKSANRRLRGVPQNALQYAPPYAPQQVRQDRVMYVPQQVRSNGAQPQAPRVRYNSQGSVPQYYQTNEYGTFR